MAMAVGAINGFAMVGVAAMQFFVGRMVQVTSSYTIPFMVAGTLYLIALVILQAILPQVRPWPIEKRADMRLVLLGAAGVLAALGYMLYATNRPTYLSLNDYLKLRPTQIQAAADPIPGPDAKVGWMDAKWYRWRLDSGAVKTELIKFDTHGQPFVEEKGDKASHYAGPTAKAVNAAAP